ncbi:hypothetical protein [Pseudarthrobacter sp. H2]|uniref:hypothetical protein n=1 Tax=Pseudarthrobacter sp. H2 TaxID=3418415 RepID=UPI003CF493BA
MFGILALVLMVPGSVGAYLYSLAHVYDSQTVTLQDAFPPEAVRIQAPEVPAGEAKAMNILVLGSDSRDTSAGAGAKAAEYRYRPWFRCRLSDRP